MRVLVTDGSGYIGRPAVAALIARGHEVHVVSRRPDAVPGATVHQGHLLEPGTPEAVTARVRSDAVLHMA